MYIVELLLSLENGLLGLVCAAEELPTWKLGQDDV